MKTNKFKVGDIAWHLYLDNKKLSEARIVKCRIKESVQGYVELEHLVDGEWVDYEEDGMRSFYDQWIFHTKSECKAMMISYWDRTEMYKAELEKITRKINKLHDDLLLIIEEDEEHKRIVKKIRRL